MTPRPEARRPSATAAAVAVLLALAFALTACGGDEEAAEPPPSESTSEPEDPEPAAPEETEPEPSADVTEPGSELAIGDTATLQGAYAGNEVVFELTVTAIDEGTGADLESLRLQNADPDELAPFYVKISSTIVSGDPEGYDPASDLTGFAGDQPAQGLIEFSEFKPCNSVAYEAGDGAGESLDSCTTQIVGTGETVDSVSFDATDTPYDLIDGEPVVWR